MVTSKTPYKHNSQTTPIFLIKTPRDFETEKAYPHKTQQLREAHSFGPLNKPEWNNMFYKQLDHYLSQFARLCIAS
jgi:hypothetical protein